MALSDKEKIFADEWIISGNAYQAALKAGYAKQTAKESSKWINPAEARKNPNRFKPELRAYIDKRMAEKEKILIASQDEVLRYLTSVLRGESESEVVVVEGVGEGCSEARRMKKAPDEKERLKAAELLGKRYGLYTDKIEQAVDMELNITIDYGDTDAD